MLGKEERAALARRSGKREQMSGKNERAALVERAEKKEQMLGKEWEKKTTLYIVTLFVLRWLELCLRHRCVIVFSIVFSVLSFLPRLCHKKEQTTHKEYKEQ